MKAIDQYFPVMLFVKLYKVVLHVTIWQYKFPVVLFIKLYKVVLTFFESVDKILRCDHLNESY